MKPKARMRDSITPAADAVANMPNSEIDSVLASAMK